MQYPYAPPPPPQQQRRSFWRWYRSRGCFQQGVLGCLPFFLIGCGVLCVLATPAFMQGVRNGIATQTATIHTTATANVQSTLTSGGPRMGGSLDDFVARYGLPTATAPDNETFVTSDKLVRITAYVTAGTTTVDRISASGPPTWNVNTTATFCSQFLPDDAVETNRVIGDADFIDYSSSLGKIVLQLQTQNCLLFIAPS